MLNCRMPEDKHSVIKTCHNKVTSANILYSSYVSAGCWNAKSVVLKKKDKTLVRSTERREQKHWFCSRRDFTTVEYAYCDGIKLLIVIAKGTYVRSSNFENLEQVVMTQASAVSH